jgi:hypothetical protein
VVTGVGVAGVDVAALEVAVAVAALPGPASCEQPARASPARRMIGVTTTDRRCSVIGNSMILNGDTGVCWLERLSEFADR